MRQLLLCMFLVALALPLVSSAVLAGDGGAKSFGSTICIKQTECPNSESDIEVLVNQAGNCVGRYYGFKRDIFDSSAGLDYNNCIATRGTRTFGSSPVAMAPHCCYEDVGEGLCQLKCEILAVAN